MKSNLYRRLTNFILRINKPSKDKKPKTPKKVYKWGILYYTIIDYYWVDPNSKEAKIFKTGWMPQRIYNYAHPKMQKDLQRLKAEQKRIRKSGELTAEDWEELRKIKFLPIKHP